MENNWSSNFADKTIVKKIALTSVFLSFALIFQFLEKYMPLNIANIKINLSIIFIFPIFYFCDFKFGALSLITRFLLGPLLDFFGYSAQNIINHFILLICSFITVLLLYFNSFIFKKIKKYQVKIAIINASTCFLTSLILALLNMVLFVPIYLSFYFPSFKAFDFNHINFFYEKIKIFYFNIDNYWQGIFIASFVGNFIKYSIIYFIYFLLNPLLNKYLKK